MTPGIGAFCTACGAARRAEHRFCTTCGSAGSARAHSPVPSPSATRRRRTPVVLGVALLAIVVGVGSALGVALLGDRDSSEPGEPGYDGDRIPVGLPEVGRADVLGAPGSEWTLDAAEVLGDGATVTAIRDYWDGYVAPETMVMGDVAVAWVVSEWSDDGTDTGSQEGVLLGLDPDTGERLWEIASADANGACEPVASATRLLCAGISDRSPTDSDDRAPLTLVDPATGESTTSEATFRRGSVLTTTGGTYVVEFGDLASDVLGLHAIDLDDLSPRWSTDVDLSAAQYDIYPSLDESPGLDTLALTAGGQRWMIDPDDGTIDDQVTDDASFEQGYRITEGYTEGAAESDTTVTDLGGQTILAAPGTRWWGDGGRSIVDGRIGIGDTLYDLTTGETLWSSASGEQTTRFADEGRVVLATGGDGSTRPYDAATGEDLFDATADLDLTHADWFGPTAIAAVGEDGLLRMHAREGGEVRWDADLRGVLVDGFGNRMGGDLAASGTALVAVGTSGLHGFSDFPAVGDDGSAGSVDPAGEDGGDSDDGADGTDYVTDCGSEPELVPADAKAADGGVVVTFTVTAVCPDGQWLAHTDTWVELSVDGATYLAGSFDFASDPRWVPADGGELDLVFPPGTTFATADEVDEALDDGGERVVVDCVRGDAAEPGAVPASPDDADPGSDPVTGDAPRDPDVDPEESALATLQRIAAADAPYLDDEIAGGWTPQLSSKQLGIVAEGTTWSYADILAEHLRLRLRYPGVRLAYSTDWGTYRFDDFWVTLAADRAYARPQRALDFCRDGAFAPTNCYAKLLSRAGTWDGATASVE